MTFNEKDNFNYLGDKIDQGIKEDRDILICYNKAQEILKKERISERDFDTLYGENQVSNDLRYMAEHKMIFKTDLSKNTEKLRAKKFASILEAVFIERVNKGEWFGSDVNIIIPSQYDEIKNGVDSIAKFKEKGKASSYLALAIDVTFSKKAENKIIKIQEDIKNKKIPEIKYFKTEGFQGKLLNIPKVIIGTDLRTVRELSVLWKNNEEEKIKNHPVQKEILSEIVMQLEKFEKECLKNKMYDLANSYNHAFNVILKIVKEKEYDLKSVKGGEVYQNIKNYLNF
jgi:hypothetical protein